MRSWCLSKPHRCTWEDWAARRTCCPPGCRWSWVLLAGRIPDHTRRSRRLPALSRLRCDSRSSAFPDPGTPSPPNLQKREHWPACFSLTGKSQQEGQFPARKRGRMASEASTMSHRGLRLSRTRANAGVEQENVGAELNNHLLMDALFMHLPRNGFFFLQTEEPLFSSGNYIQKFGNKSDSKDTYDVDFK